VTEGLIDTSVLIDWDDPAVVAALPDMVAVSAITIAELVRLVAGNRRAQCHLG